MSTLTKLTKSPPADYHTWDQTEFANGDIIDIQASLGKPCRHLTIACEGDSAVIKLNVVRKIYKNQESVGNRFMQDAAFWPSPAFVGEVEVATDSITLAADTTYLWDEEFPILDIKIITKSPLMRIQAS